MRKLIGVTLLALLGGPATADEPHPLFPAGLEAYEFFCSKCHGKDMVNSGVSSFDLRKFPVDQKERFYASVQNGRGSMPAWGDVIYPEELDALWVYVATRGGTQPFPEQDQSGIPFNQKTLVKEGTLTACLSRNAGALSGLRSAGGTGFDYRVSETLSKALNLDLDIVWIENEVAEESNPVHETYAMLAYGLCDIVPSHPLYARAVGEPPTDKSALPRWLGMPEDYDAETQRPIPAHLPHVSLKPVAVTQPYMRAEIGLAYLDGSAEPANPGSIGNRRIAYQQGTLSGALLELDAPDQMANAVSFNPGPGFLWRLETGDADVAIVEIGGTIGDIEGLPFLEATRQLKVDLGPQRAMLMHLTLVPYIATAGETKTKPTQHSVKELRSIGLQPDILLCRSDHTIDEGSLKKISSFTNVELRAVIPLEDADSIYKIPGCLHERGLDSIIVERFGLECGDADLTEWDRVVDGDINPTKEVTIAMVGKYMELLDAYKSLIEAVKHAGINTHTKINFTFVDSEDIEKQGTDALANVDAILVPGGFGSRGVEGKIATVRYARENKIPYLGICLGMQVAVIEFARNVAELEGANSTEFNKQSAHPVVGLITEWKDASGSTEVRDESTDLGGTMRLGGQECRLVEGSNVQVTYGKDLIIERHRHRYEVNNNYVDQLQKAGLRIGGWSADDTLVEVVEAPDHPWFIACQFHPEFTSTPRDGHPLFTGFVNAAIKQSGQ